VTRYLVDTNVLSATAPATAVRRPELIEWMDSHSPDLFLSAITIAEIADDIAKAKREGTKRKASDLAAWLRIVLHLYGDRVLPFATARQRRWPTPWPIWHAAAVILRALPISQLLRQPVGITLQSSRATSAFRTDGRSRRRPVPETSCRQIGGINHSEHDRG
jgi:hypothetical protein